MAVFSFAPYNLLKIASRSCAALLEVRRKQMATTIGNPYSVCQTSLESFCLFWTSDTNNIPSLYMIYGSYHGFELRGCDIKHIYQLIFTHPQVLQVGRNGKPSISVHGDYSPFHAIPPIAGKCPLIRLSKTDMSWSSLVLVTLAYICVVVIFV